MDSVIGGIILLLACIGNAEWWVILVNRRHSMRRRHKKLRWSRRIHDAGVLLFPPFILYLAGFGQHGLLSGSHFAYLPAATRIILWIALSGLLPLTYSVIRWQLQKPPVGLLHMESQRFDVLKQASGSVQSPNDVRGHIRPLISRLPGNEIFQLDVNRKRLQIGKVHSDGPVSESKTLRIAHFSDIHLTGCPGRDFYRFVTEQLCLLQPDAYMFTGDLLDKQELLPWAVEMFERLATVAPGYFILGNHDWHLNADQIRRKIVDSGWTNIAQTCLTTRFQNTQILIAGTEAPWMGANPAVPERSDEHLRLLLSHSPDQRNYACRNGFDLMLSGHNHGGQVVLPVIGPVYSPSRYGVKYAGGTYQHRELMFHVSRGIAAKDSFRWNSSPEVTLLELEISRWRSNASNGGTFVPLIFA